MAIAGSTAIKISPVNMDSRKKLGIRAGDTVRVWQKIQEKGKTRLQAFEGLVLARKHGNEAGATFTVRKIASGVGVEKIFPLYSPAIDKIEIVKRSKVRRAKLYHIRKKVAKDIKRQMRHATVVGLQTVSGKQETNQNGEESNNKIEETNKEKIVGEEKTKKKDEKEEVK